MRYGGLVMQKKKRTALLLCLLFAITSLVSCGGEKDFRGANWGDSISKVSNSEETDYFFASDDILAYNGRMFDIDAEILYTFEDGALSEAQSKFLVGEWILADIIPHYKALVESLREQYGAPLQDDYYIYHTDKPAYEEHKNDTEIYQVYYQVLEYKAEWKTERTYYSLSLNYQDEQINYILYACPVERAPQ